MRRIVLTVCAMAAFGAGAAHGYSDIFASGDSLSDGGNAFAIASPTTFPPVGWPPSPPYSGRFSNGPTAVEQLAPLLNLPPLLPSSAGGRNYAVGGATTGTGNYNFSASMPPDLPPALGLTGMRNQVDALIAANPTGLSPDSLFFLWGGPNDIFLASLPGSTTTPLEAAGQAASRLEQLVKDLADKGARNFLVPMMPDLGLTPMALATGDPVYQAGLTGITAYFNAQLDGKLMALELANPEYEITVFNTFALLRQVTMNPGNYGLTNVTSPCFLLASCDGYLYFDTVHPTTFTHGILADALHTTLVPEPGTWAMLAIGLLALAVVARRRRTT